MPARVMPVVVGGGEGADGADGADGAEGRSWVQTLTWRDMKLNGLADLERDRLDRLGDWAREARNWRTFGGGSDISGPEGAPTGQTDGVRGGRANCEWRGDGREGGRWDGSLVGVSCGYLMRAQGRRRLSGRPADGINISPGATRPDWRRLIDTYLRSARAAGVALVGRARRLVERARPAARVPGDLALEVHLLAGHEGVAALGAAGAAGVEVVRLAGLEHLARYVALAVDAGDAEELLVVAFAVGSPLPGHVLAVEGRLAVGALEAPDVPVGLERDQGLAVGDALAAAGALGARRLSHPTSGQRTLGRR